MLFGEARSRDHARACTVDVFPLVLGRIERLFRKEESQLLRKKSPIEVASLSPVQMGYLSTFRCSVRVQFQ